jgi:hypothetical protein
MVELFLFFSYFVSGVLSVNSGFSRLPNFAVLSSLPGD